MEEKAATVRLTEAELRSLIRATSTLDRLIADDIEGTNFSDGFLTPYRRACYKIVNAHQYLIRIKRKPATDAAWDHISSRPTS